MPRKKKTDNNKNSKVKSKKKGVRTLLASRYKTLLGSMNVGTISTGFKPVDTILGGGFARGQYCLVAGYEGSGKTTLMLQTIKSAQEDGMLPIIIDTEFAMGDDRIREFGIKIADENSDEYGSTDALYIQPSSIEQVSSIIDDIAKWKYNGDIPPDQEILIVWDSITSTPTSIEIEESLDDQQPALVARILSKFVKKHAKYLEPLGITLIAVGQYRDKIEMNQFAKKINPLKLDDGKSIPGGNAIKFKAFQLITLEPRGNFEISKGKVLGRIIKFRSVKNKLISPQLVYEAVLTYTKGFNNFVDMYNALMREKYFKKATQQTYYLQGYDEPDKENNKDGTTFSKPKFFRLVRENEEFKEKCIKYYQEICEKILNPEVQMNDLLEGRSTEDEEESEEMLSVSEMIEDIADRKGSK